MSLSVVLATYNEEKNLPGCLASVKDLADEIVIVDGTSSDNTIHIAKKYGAKVHITKNLPNFHINKQKAIDLATKDWILQLDADERVTPELAREIHSVISKNNVLRDLNGISPSGRNDKEVNGYWIPRKNWFLGRYLMKGGVYPDYTLRLYKKGKGRLPQKDVHEQAVVEGKTEYLKNPLIHIADPEFTRYFLRFKRYTSFIAMQYADQKLGKNVVTCIKYIVLLPTYWFLKVYIRHKGFMDGWQGFIFAFFSALRFPVSYVKYIRQT
jgi:glycosyltransferase involved in cell wall biosynthesis